MWPSASSSSSISTSDEYLTKNTTTTMLPKQTNLELLENFFWYHGRLDKMTACELLERNGQFLVRSARSKVDRQIKTVLSIKWNNRHYHFVIKKSGKYFTIEELQFDSIIHLISFYFISKVRLILITI
ncbi:Breast cancer anti-estrogen resistance protein [Dirofilaria immitis]